MYPTRLPRSAMTPEEHLKTLLFFRPFIHAEPKETRPKTVREAVEYIRQCRFGKCETCGMVNEALAFYDQWENAKQFERELLE